YEARLALEPLAIARAATRFDGERETLASERLAVLNGLIEENSPETWAAHTAFHFALYEASDSSWLLRLIRPLWETSQRYRLPVAAGAKAERLRAEHDASLAAR